MESEQHRRAARSRQFELALIFEEGEFGLDLHGSILHEWQ
jgi:hypothetical protein